MKTKGRPDDIDRLVGLKVREARLAKGLSQVQVANAIGVTFQQIQKYEKGTNRMSSSRLYQFSKFVEVKLEFFFSDAPMNNTVAENGNFLKDYAKLSPKQRAAIAKMTKELANAI